jgi:hypothetical protein
VKNHTPWRDPLKALTVGLPANVQIQQWQGKSFPMTAKQIP